MKKTHQRLPPVLFPYHFFQSGKITHQKFRQSNNLLKVHAYLYLQKDILQLSAKTIHRPLFQSYHQRFRLFYKIFQFIYLPKFR